MLKDYLEQRQISLASGRSSIAAEHGYSSDQISRLLNQKQKNVTQEYVQKTLTMLKAPLLIFVRVKEKALGE